MAVLGFVLGMVQAASVLMFARSAGNGPVYNCSYDCMAMNQDPKHAAVNGGGNAYYQQPQPQPQLQVSVPT